MSEKATREFRQFVTKNVFSQVSTFEVTDFCTVLFLFFSCCSPYSICFAKHVNDKAARWAKSKRPRKSRPSDINRTPVMYQLQSLVKPAEYSISDEPASPMPKLAKSG